MGDPRVLIVAGDAVETQELFYPYWRLREEGVEVVVAAPSKKEALYTVVHDFEPGWETYTEKPGYRFIWVDMAYGDVRPEEFDGLIIPGGRAPEYMRTKPELESIVKHFFEANKPVAAICHGPLAIAGYGLARGRRMTCYMTVAPDLKQAGAEYVDEEVVVDGNLVTSRAWPDLPAFMREFLRLLRERGG
jgi:protease I